MSSSNTFICAWGALPGRLRDVKAPTLERASSPLCENVGSYTFNFYKGATHGILGTDTRPITGGRIFAIGDQENRRGNCDTGMRWHHAPLDRCNRPRRDKDAGFCMDDAYPGPGKRKSTTERLCCSCGVSPACCAAQPRCQPAEQRSANTTFLAALSFSWFVRGPVLIVLRISSRLLSGDKLRPLVNCCATLTVATIANRDNCQRLVVVTVVIFPRWSSAINTSERFGWQHAPVPNLHMNRNVSLRCAAVDFERQAARNAIFPAEMNIEHFNSAHETSFVYPAMLFEVNHDSNTLLSGDKPTRLDFFELVDPKVWHKVTPLRHGGNRDIQ